MIMQSTKLTDLIEEQIILAGQGDTSGRSAKTLHGGRGRALRQTLVVMLAGHRMDEHVSPGEATVLVLGGTLKVHTAEHQIELGEGDFLIVPPDRHSVDALEDSAFLLTVIKPEGHGYRA